MREKIIDENGIVGELILDIRSLISGVFMNGRQYLGSWWMRSVGTVVVRGFLYTILATCEKSRRPTSVYRRSLLQALDVIQSDSEVGFYDSLT